MIWPFNRLTGRVLPSRQLTPPMPSVAPPAQKRDIIERLMDDCRGPFTANLYEDGALRNILHVDAAKEIERLRGQVAALSGDEKLGDCMAFEKVFYVCRIANVLPDNTFALQKLYHPHRTRKSAEQYIVDQLERFKEDSGKNRKWHYEFPEYTIMETYRELLDDPKYHDE